MWSLVIQKNQKLLGYVLGSSNELKIKINKESTMEKPVIGFIGVGLMGAGMAKNILAKGYSLVIMGHSNREPIERLKKLGAVEAKTAKELASQVDIVHLCVTGSPQIGRAHV